MEIYDKLIKPILEVNYLRAENADRYRTIIRYFFNEYENIQYWLYKEDIFEMMMKTGYFEEYTIEKCQSDLDSLSQWGNLTAMQDSAKVSTIEDFKNKKYRYQLSEYTVEIERMILKLENLEVEGSSLEPTLLERLNTQLRRFPKILEESDIELNSWWRSISNDFMRLNQDYQDYLRTLNSHKAEEMMKSEEFLIFKDHLIVYLRTFVKSLQDQGALIEVHLRNIDTSIVEELFDRIVQYELSIPRIERQLVAKDLYYSTSRRWQNLCNWFVGVGENSELDRLYNITNDIIRKITRYAQQIGEMRHQSSNRKEEYRHIAKLFSMCEDIYEAHKMSANVFGVTAPFHFIDLDVRETDDIDQGVYQGIPTVRSLEPHTTIARKTAPRIKAIDYSLEQTMERMEIEKRKEREEKILRSHIKDGRIVFDELPNNIDANTRKVLLSWLSKAMQRSKHNSKTEFGAQYRLDLSKIEERCVLHCEDGNFNMPKITIIFEEDSL